MLYGCRRMKYIFLVPLFFLTLSLVSQETTTSNTSLSLSYAVNLTSSPMLSSHSIGGDWGLVLDHQLVDSRFGLTAGIYYSLVHVGFEDEFTPPDEALEFGFLQSAFGVTYSLLPRSRALRLRLSYIHGLIRESDNFGLSNFNIPIVAGGVEYQIPTHSKLLLAVGWQLNVYAIDRDNLGRQWTNALYFKVGMGS